MGIGKRIKEARNALNLTQEELANLLGITKGAVANYEKETSHPKESIMYKMIEVLKVDANFLFQDMVTLPETNNDVTLTEYALIKKYRHLDKYGKDLIDTVLDKEIKRIEESKENHPDLTIAQQDMRVVRYYQRMASAGTGQVVFEDMPTERIQIPDIPDYRCVSYAIGVNGDSMEPLYYDGDILLVETTLQIEIGEIGIFIVDGEAFVKQLGEGKLISLNKKYKDIPLTEYSNCMGKVVGKLEAQ